MVKGISPDTLSCKADGGGSLWSLSGELGDACSLGSPRRTAAERGERSLGYSRVCCEQAVSGRLAEGQVAVGRAGANLLGL